MADNDIKIGIIGLGYVGLPLAVAFGEKFKTIGFDIDSERILELQKKNDRTNELSQSQIEQAHFLEVSDEESSIKDCNVFESFFS